MERNRFVALGSILAAFVVVVALQAIFFPDNREIWHLFEILAILAAILFYIPGAIVGIIAAIGAGLIFVTFDNQALLDYSRMAIIVGVIGWFASRQHLQQEYLGRLLMVDRLTGLHNYSYFIDRLEEERKRADRFGSRLSLIMIDIDHFKVFNDEHGHQKGNQLLKHLADIFKIQVRGVDVVSRYGGEEFAVLLPNTGRMAAQEVAERIRVAVEQGDFPTANGAEKRTISAGVATYPIDAEDDLRLIDKADEALTTAKGSGRNRVVTFGSDKPQHQAIN